MKNRKIALLAIPVFAAIMIGATVAPVHAGNLIGPVDIMPGSDPNLIDPSSRGVIPVAIFGSNILDVADIDVDSLAFGPGGAAPAHKKVHFEDVNDDGITDLVSHYRTQETGIAVGDTGACITGNTFDGTSIEGCDNITVSEENS